MNRIQKTVLFLKLVVFVSLIQNVGFGANKIDTIKIENGKSLGAIAFTKNSELILGGTTGTKPWTRKYSSKGDSLWTSIPEGTQLGWTSVKKIIPLENGKISLLEPIGLSFLDSTGHNLDKNIQVIDASLGSLHSISQVFHLKDSVFVFGGAFFQDYMYSSPNIDNNDAWIFSYSGKNIVFDKKFGSNNEPIYDENLYSLTNGTPDTFAFGGKIYNKGWCGLANPNGTVHYSHTLTSGAVVWANYHSGNLYAIFQSTTSFDLELICFSSQKILWRKSIPFPEYRFSQVTAQIYTDSARESILVAGSVLPKLVGGGFDIGMQIIDFEGNELWRYVMSSSKSDAFIDISNTGKQIAIAATWNQTEQKVFKIIPDFETIEVTQQIKKSTTLNQSKNIVKHFSKDKSGYRALIVNPYKRNTVDFRGRFSE